MPTWLRLSVAAVLVVAGVGGCGANAERAISLRVVGELRSGVPSAIAWQVELDGPAEIVTVAGDALVLTNDVKDRVWGLDTQRGGEVFEIDPSATPWDRGPLVTVAGDRVLLSERRSNSPGDTWMVAFDVANGGQLWSVRLDRDDARPHVVGDAVIVATRGRPDASVPGEVRSIALADGSERWSLPLGLAPDLNPDAGDFDDTAPVLSVDGNTLAVRTGISSVVLVDVAEGREVGSFDVEGEILGVRPVAPEGVVLVSERLRSASARVHALEADTARLRWTVETRRAEVWVSGSALVVYGLDRDYEAYAIGSGERLWTAAGDYGRIIAESEGFLVTDRLAAFVRTNGDLAWSHFDSYADQVWFVPGVAIIDALDGVMALDLRSGEPRWSRPASVVAVGDAEVLTNEGDERTLVDAASGAELWMLTVPEGSFTTALRHNDDTLFVSVTGAEKAGTTVLALEPNA